MQNYEKKLQLANILKLSKTYETCVRDTWQKISDTDKLNYGFYTSLKHYCGNN